MKHNECLGKKLIPLALVVLFGALAIELMIALVGIAVAVAIGNDGSLVLAILYSWPIFFLSLVVSLTITIAKCCFCWFKNSICCEYMDCSNLQCCTEPCQTPECAKTNDCDEKSCDSKKKSIK